jgi:purine-binding chemotaxis protein CheW
MTDTATSLLVFGVEGQRYALRLSAVERVVRMVEITPLPQAPSIVVGVIDPAGEIVPVVSLRRRMGAPERPVRLSDQLIAARAAGRRLTLAVDGVEGVIEPPPAAVAAATDLYAGLGEFEGAVRLEDGLLLIHDLHKFLTPAEVATLDAALHARNMPAPEGRA